MNRYNFPCIFHSKIMSPGHFRLSNGTFQELAYLSIPHPNYWTNTDIIPEVDYDPTIALELDAHEYHYWFDA